MTPDELARRLGISPRTLRGWLRGEGFRSSAERGQAWFLDQRIVDAATARFSGGVRPAAAPKPAGKQTTGKRWAEGYVVDLCDGILGEAALRNHPFPWLLSDPDRNGRRRPLRVDAYYPDHGIVVEYQGRQHSEPVKHFDRRETVSGVGRGVQRRLYDERRNTEIPAHGLRLVLVAPEDLDSTKGGTLRRNTAHDRAVLMGLLGIAAAPE